MANPIVTLPASGDMIAEAIPTTSRFMLINGTFGLDGVNFAVWREAATHGADNTRRCSLAQADAPDVTPNFHPVLIRASALL